MQNSMQKPVALSIVIPAYNEERRLPASLRDIRTFFESVQLPIEFLVVVEKSSDQTLEMAREAVQDDPRFQVIDNHVHRGKGYAVKSGMLRARGDIILFMDADLSTPLNEVFHFLAHFAQHPETDILIGSREHARSMIVRKQGWIRRVLGRTFNRFVQRIAMDGITDTQCGFKAFRARACHGIFDYQVTDGFAFDVEILMLAQELGYKIDVLPVHWENSPDSKVRVWIDPLKMFWDLLWMRRLVRRSVREQAMLPGTVIPQKRVPAPAQSPS